jgi:type IV pilus assembly protein PilW
MPQDAGGVTLIELMIALVLGLIVSGAALALFVTNRRTYVASENLGRVQENARTAFELMSRDVREAGGNPCDAKVTVGNVLNNTAWWNSSVAGVVGYGGAAAFGGAAFGTAAKSRVNGTDAIELRSGVDTGIKVDPTMPEQAAVINVVPSNSGISDNDILMICDFNQAAIFQVTMLPSTIKIQHNNGAGSPGNCQPEQPSNPWICKGSGAAGPGLPFSPDALVAKLRVSGWYVGCNGRASCASPPGRSLYQVNVTNDGTGPVAGADEITEGVNNMELTYLMSGDTSYVAAGAVTDWGKVVAVSIELDMVGQDKVGTDNDVLHRTLAHVVTLRSRVQ